METWKTIWLFNILCLIHGKLTDKLRYYETIDRHDIVHRVSRRSLDGGYDYIKHVNFNSHGEKFRLNLVPSQEIFSSSFEAVVVNSKQKERKVLIDKKSFYHGFDEAHPSSDVIAHIEDGILDAKISTSEETYFIEPMWRHGHPTHDMVIYKASNVNSTLMNDQAFCNVLNDAYNYSFNHSQELHLSRQRRDTIITKNNTCELILIADHTYYQHVGGSNGQTCIHNMLQIIMRVNRIFRRTYWKGVGSNIGVQVKKIVVYESPTKSTNEPSFNQQRVWTANSLLNEFAYGNWNGYCLAHLFTYQDFADNTLGLAYIALPGGNGGICGTGYFDSTTRKRHQNCALTTSVEKGKRLLNIEADLVTAHEIAHNFGAFHDESSRCSPSQTDGGKYLMYPKAVKGGHANNYIFSACSNEEISRVLKVKRLKCFKDESRTHCGNSIVERGEECDSGFFEDGDSCCHKNCTFRDRRFECSDANDDCCFNCTIATSTTVCRPKSEILCQNTTFCDGVSKSCPSNSPPLSGNNCGFNKGKCVQGVCKNLCTLEEPMKYRCQCPSPEECQICCRSSNTSSSLCTPLVTQGVYISENDGVPCDVGGEPGECVSGRCERIMKDVEDEFTSLIDDFTFSKFGRFLATNIVGTMLFFSVLLWIPLSCIVHFIDKKKIKLPKVSKKIAPCICGPSTED